MIEMRREKRWPAHLELEISSLFKQDYEQVENLHEHIEILDVSKVGIGFKTKAVLPVGYYFNARLILGSDPLNCVVKIIRQQEIEDGYIYGCEIVGGASIMNYVFDDYAASIQAREAEKAAAEKAKMAKDSK